MFLFLFSGFKETSFLYAVSSASLVHTFARGCRSGQIDRCTCDESKHLNNVEAWKWGGCGDNIKFALKFTRRFLRRAKTLGKDVTAKVNQHNSRVGIKVGLSTPGCHNLSVLLHFNKQLQHSVNKVFSPKKSRIQFFARFCFC